MKPKVTKKKTDAKGVSPVIAALLILLIIGIAVLDDVLLLALGQSGGWVCFACSVLAFFAFVCGALARKNSKDHGKKILSSLHFFTIGVFVSLIFLLFPLYFRFFEGAENPVFPFVHQFLASVHHAFRAFILDGEYRFLTDEIAAYPRLLQQILPIWGGFLFILAPFLTFSNLLSLFKGLRNEMAFRLKQFFGKNTVFYVFSDLNERSIAMAESIRQKGKRAIVVFTDVFTREDEDNYELQMKALDIQALVLRKDITRLSFRKGVSVEFFLIGTDDSENLRQAIFLTEENKGNRHRKVYLFSYQVTAKSSAGYLLDSLDKGVGRDSVSEEEIDNIVRAMKQVEGYRETVNAAAKRILENGFSIRRIDCIDFLSTDILISREVTDALCPPPGAPKEISIMILGTGEHGISFLRNALWLYQIYGYQLNVFLLDKADSASIVSKLQRDWSEIEFNQAHRVDEDSSYCIRILGGIDFDTNAINQAFLDHEEEFKKIRLAIVALGNDEKNIDFAVKLRRLFDRLQNVTSVEKEARRDLPLIYSIVYNETMSSNLTGANELAADLELQDYKSNPYHIRFVGGMQELYSYETMIEKSRRYAENAFFYHLDWTFKNVKASAFRNDSLPDYPLDQQKDVEKLRSEIDSGRLRLKTDDEVKSSIRRAVDSYLNNEFPVVASVAKENYQVVYRALVGRVEHENATRLFCFCEDCKKARISEHMRWNMFMRTRGYRQGPRADRALEHPSIRPWNELELFEQLKD